MNSEFNDINHYSQEMAKSSYDKLGFTNRIYEDIDLIVDFGCADGTVTRFMQLFYPEATIIGYDLEEILAKYNNVDEEGSIYYKSDLNEIKTIVNNYSENNCNSLLVMNSVHHELFNYMQPDKSSIASKESMLNDESTYYGLLNSLYSMGFTYIFIRDLNVQVPIVGKSVDYIPVELAKLNQKIYSLGYGEQFKQFLDVYNSSEPLNPMTLEGQEQYIHFLLKCRYKKNWERELHENYLAKSHSFPKDKIFLSTLKKYPYHMTDGRNYVLPYTNFINKKEFGIDLKALNIRTHSQAIYRLNSKKSEEE